MILVAGGTGTLGAPLVRMLAASGDRVRVLTRDPGRAEALRAAGIEATRGDVRDPAAVARACTGCTTVISAVHGFTGRRGAGPAAIDRDANVALVGACADARVHHLILVSVLGASPTHPMSLHRMKYAAEQALAAGGVPWTIVRPAPFLETWTDLIGAQLPVRGLTLVFGKGDNPINFVSVRDVVDRIAQAVHDERLRGRVVDITGAEQLTFNQIAARLAAAAGVPLNTRHVPLPVLRAMSLLAKPLAPALARQARAAVVMNTTDM